MNSVELLIICIIILTYPMLTHQYFILYNMNINKEKKKILSSFTIYISLLLSLEFKYLIPNNYLFVLLILPLILSYINKKPATSIVVSIITGEYIYTLLHYNIFTLIIYYLILFILYFIYYHFNKNNIFYINISSIFFFLIIIYNTYDISNALFCIILYLLSLYIINKGMDESKNILNMHMTLKELERDKDIKLNLFKITHEIKNPLTVIKGFLDIFNIDNKDKSIKYINIMKEEVSRTLNLLQDYLDLSKIKLNKSTFTISKLIDDIKYLVIPLYNSNNIKYTFNIEDIIYNGDFNRLKQVLFNVIKNSIEASSINIDVTIYSSDNNLYIIVKDNGIGMDNDTINMFEEPFYTTKDKGTGLGVTLSKEIIKCHKGNIKYKSILNKGTTCKIILPINNNMA